MNFDRDKFFRLLPESSEKDWIEFENNVELQSKLTRQDFSQVMKNCLRLLEIMTN